jgi:hypothetical protein
MSKEDVNKKVLATAREYEQCCHNLFESLVKSLSQSTGLTYIEAMELLQRMTHGY